MRRKKPGRAVPNTLDIPLNEWVALAAVLIACLGMFALRRQLSPGVGEVALVLGTGGIAFVLADLRDLAALLVDPRRAHVPTGLAVAWYILSFVIRGPQSGGAAREIAERRDGAGRTLRWAAFLAGGLALAALIPHDLTPNPAMRSSAMLDLGLLAGVCLLGAIAARSSGDWLALLTITALGGWLLRPEFSIEPWAKYIQLGQLAAAFGALALVLAGVLVEWLLRRRRSLSAPERLVRESPRGRFLAGIAALLALAAGVGVLLYARRPLSTVAALVAALAAFGAGHRSAVRPFSWLGLALLCEALSLVCLSFAADWRAHLIVSGALVGTLVNWLGNFWRQQVAPTGPWTTTGALAELAALAGAAGAGVSLLGALLLVSTPGPPSAETLLGLGLLVLVQAWLLARAASVCGDVGAEHAAGIAALGAALLAERWVLSQFGASIPLLVLLAGAWLLVTVRASLPFNGRRPGAASCGLLLGGLPLLLLLALGRLGASPAWLLALILNIVGLLVIGAARSRRQAPDDARVAV